MGNYHIDVYWHNSCFCRSHNPDNALPAFTCSKGIMGGRDAASHGPWGDCRNAQGMEKEDDICGICHVGSRGVSSVLYTCRGSERSHMKLGIIDYINILPVTYALENGKIPFDGEI